jgi:hypothetical protein
MSEEVGYGIDYRNMRTALHGIIWTKNKHIAEDIYGVFLDLESDDSETVSNAEADLDFYVNSADVFVEDEIYFKDITYTYNRETNKFEDGKYYFDDDTYVVILNDIAFDLYGW